jgi:7-dehydrocholesterol reductase
MDPIALGLEAVAPDVEVSSLRSRHVSKTSTSSSIADPSLHSGWGRHVAAENSSGWQEFIMASGMLGLVGPAVLLTMICFRMYDCSLFACLRDLFFDFPSFVSHASVFLASSFSVQAFYYYAGWLVFQLSLYLFVPGPTCMGQMTPGGYILEYRVNGFRCWVITHILLVAAIYTGKINPNILYDQLPAFVVYTLIAGHALTIVAYVKARVAPSHIRDVKFSGSFFYDLAMGAELNPRIGSFDFKLFFNGRPGIIGWTVFNILFAYKQYSLHGLVTNSMIAVNILHAIYVIDFFWHESWYTRTIDIAHDHFGFYLCVGDLAWLPWMYTLQCHYLVAHPVVLSNTFLTFVYALGISGYVLFRLVNHQKDFFRAQKGNCSIWGKPAQFIRAPYVTAEGTKHEGLLLISGYWGLSRHLNYVGDLMLSSAFCLACGDKHILPYFYIIYMTILLVHRVHRDDERCRNKYGSIWQQYTEVVKYKILPFVY